jgi:hypothetical protein
MEKEFDIAKVFEDTAKSLRDELLATNAKISFIQEIEQFFKTNNLKVYQEVPEEPKEAPVEKPVASKK